MARPSPSKQVPPDRAGDLGLYDFNLATRGNKQCKHKLHKASKANRKQATDRRAGMKSQLINRSADPLRRNRYSDDTRCEDPYWR